MNDHEILSLFFRRDEAAIQESQHKYGAYCAAIARNILGNEEDTNEILNDLWLRVWHAIPPARPPVFRAYLGKITRNLAINRHQAAFAQKRGADAFSLSLEELDQCLPDPRGTDESLYARELAQMINAFLATEQKLDRQIFVNRYFYCHDLKTIARGLHLTEAGVKSRLHRCRNRLRKHLISQGITL